MFIEVGKWWIENINVCVLLGKKTIKKLSDLVYSIISCKHVYFRENQPKVQICRSESMIQAHM